LIYAAIMSAVFLIFFRGDNVLGAIAGVLISGPLYLGFGAIMAKFGYQRTRLKDMRGAAKGTPKPETETETLDREYSRAKPAPTSRTAGGGAGRPSSSNRKKR
jgi:hypothetical protein